MPNTKDQLKGITFNGKSLSEQMVELGFDSDFESDEEQIPVKKKLSVFEFNRKNMDRNVYQSVKFKDIKRAIVSVLLGLDEEKTLIGIFSVIRNIMVEKDELNLLYFSGHSMRNPLGIILKTQFAQFLDITPRSSKSAKYKIHKDYKDKFTIDQAMKMIEADRKEMKKEREKPKKKQEDPDKKQKLASFKLPTKNGVLDINIFGNIKVEFQFKIS